MECFSKNRFCAVDIIYRETEMGDDHDRWVDFEKEISDCVKIIETTSNNTNVDFYNTLKETRKYILTMKKDDVIRKLEKDLVDLNKSIELYMLLLNKSLIPVITNRDFAQIPEPQTIISFNYTDTYTECWDETVIKNTDFIHGKAGSGNVILGSGETLDGNDINTKLSCVRFKKYFQRIHNRTGSKYRSFIKERHGVGADIKNKYPDTSIYIYGHSLDVTDKDILSYIILHEFTKKVTIYYYEDGEKSDYEQSIINLIQVIGKEELTARVGDGRIEFISTEDLGGKYEKAIV